MINDGNFVQEDKPVYYLYELTMNGRVQSGIVACASIDDYLNQVIKNTRIQEKRTGQNSTRGDLSGSNRTYLFLHTEPILY